MSKTITFGAITLKSDPRKYANLHQCDQKYWAFTADWSVPQTREAIGKSHHFVVSRLGNILKAKAFKPENLSYAEELLTAVTAHADYVRECESADALDLSVESFRCYQFERLMFRLWYRDTKAAREATEPKAPKAKAPAKQEKAKAPKAKAPAKQEIAKANEATFVSKLTKAQKKELLLTLMAELLK